MASIYTNVLSHLKGPKGAELHIERLLGQQPHTKKGKPESYGVALVLPG
jgi:hypothetical protein